MFILDTNQQVGWAHWFSQWVSSEADVDVWTVKHCLGHTISYRHIGEPSRWPCIIVNLMCACILIVIFLGYSRQLMLIYGRYNCLLPTSLCRLIWIAWLSYFIKLGNEARCSHKSRNSFLLYPGGLATMATTEPDQMTLNGCVSTILQLRWSVLLNLYYLLPLLPLES